MRKEHETHANSLMQNHLSMAISKLDSLENKITLTVDSLENKITSKVESLENKNASEVVALENKITSTIASKVNALENKFMLRVDALENKITSKVESLENKNSSEVVALENKITAVDALKNELISKVDAQKDEIMLHEKNLEIIKAFLAVKTEHYARFDEILHCVEWKEGTCDDDGVTHYLHLSDIFMSKSDDFMSNVLDYTGYEYLPTPRTPEAFFPFFFKIFNRLTDIAANDHATIHVTYGSFYQAMQEMQTKLQNLY
ncbi:uncharacterized protein LOC136083995 [Hydra vulgaris]|uniref:Uncharacterized protein LOC136083995 n=1 Tax=Hydra vulgaris TaxID=6087 RepID=A0ABM4CEE0_HYDVU